MNNQSMGLDENTAQIYKEIIRDGFECQSYGNKLEFSNLLSNGGVDISDMQPKILFYIMEVASTGIKRRDGDNE